MKTARTSKYNSSPDENEDYVQELCLSNGINYEKLQKGSGCNVQTLEMFFSGFPNICGMENFPKLRVLVLVGLDIEHIENLDCLSNLYELWIAECKLSKIAGLENLKELEKLYLYDNKITKIENLSSLKKLKLLWLNSNYLEAIEGLSDLLELVEINLASNKITEIGQSLDHLRWLETVDLSNNLISCFKDLTNLTRLPNLRSVSLKDPVYGPSPVSLLCNYSTQMLYHLPNLKRLDSFDVDNKSLKDLAETTVTKKKIYYNMRVKTLERNKVDLMSKQLKEKEGLQSFPKHRMRRLFFSVKQIERELDEQFQRSPNNESKESAIKKRQNGSNAEGTRGGKNSSENEAAETEIDPLVLEKKKSLLLERIGKLEKQCHEIELCFRDSCEQVGAVCDLTMQRLLVELETGGNVRFEDGKPGDVWYTSCHDLVMSRFCAADYKELGVSGIKIHRITRVHNRTLRTKFDQKLEKVLENDNIVNITRGRSYKKLLEYLFFKWNPTILDENGEPIRVIKNGLRNAMVYQDLGLDYGVPLTNSVSIADKPRLQHCCTMARSRGSRDPFPFRHGQLIITKVFVGQAVPAKTDKRVTKSTYFDVDSAYRPRKHENCPAQSAGVKRVSTCSCNTHQSDWFVFDHQLVLPEYVVDFEYITKAKPKSPFIYYFGEGSDSATWQHLETSEDCDNDVLQMEPVIKPRPRVTKRSYQTPMHLNKLNKLRLIALTEEIILRQCGATVLECVTALNLHGNGLNRLKHISCLTGLKKLVVSFNELTMLDDLAHMVFLEHLDASFNKITTLEGLKGCNRLKYLDVSRNQLKCTREELGIMRKHIITLTWLDTRHNPWQKPETLRMRALGRLKNLEVLNRTPVTDEEITTALRMAAASRISSFALLAHARTDECKPRTLSLAPTAQVILATSRHKPVKLADEDSQWFAKVTALQMDNQRLGKLSNLEKLENLRWVSFNKNDLTKIEGFEACPNVEELSVEGNCISKLEGLSRLSQLTWLNLSSNNITSLDSGIFDRLAKLAYLDLENNYITSLRGLQNSQSLQELYIGNNQIANMREVFHIKSIPGMIILDLCGNPLSVNNQNYRLFVIYHLPSLKALDGVAVEPCEGGLARDTFGGRMTPDLIAERLGHSNFSELKELDFPHSSLRTVDLGSGEIFINLRSVNLEHNTLTSFGGLINLTNLKVLCLNYNHIESIVPKPKVVSPANLSKRGGVDDITNPECFTPVLVNLEVLHLGYNGILNMAALQLSRLPNLKALFLQGNEISKIEGLHGLQELRELVLDRNKVKNLSPVSFANQWNMVELHIEENRLRDLSNFVPLQNLQRLYLGMNRIQEVAELEKLECLSNLIELSVINNAVTRRLLHRPMLVFRMPNLLCIDGIPVSSEERTKAELYFIEQQGGMQSNFASMDSSLPGISKPQAPLRVTTMHLGCTFDQWGPGARQDCVTLASGNPQRQLEMHEPNKGRRRAGGGRGALSYSLTALATSEAAQSAINDRYGRSFSGGSLPPSNSHQPPVSGSTSVTYIPHGVQSNPAVNRTEQNETRTKNSKFR